MIDCLFFSDNGSHLRQRGDSIPMQKAHRLRMSLGWRVTAFVFITTNEEISERYKYAVEVVSLFDILFQMVDSFLSEVWNALVLRNPQGFALGYSPTLDPVLDLTFVSFKGGLVKISTQ